jgi:hypothetical protein
VSIGSFNSPICEFEDLDSSTAGGAGLVYINHPTAIIIIKNGMIAPIDLTLLLIQIQVIAVV